MINEFSNEAWHLSNEKDAYIRILKSIRYHKALERLDGPTTNLLFISRLSDFPLRQHFEESSRHFKTFNVFNSVSLFFDAPNDSQSGILRKLPYWILNFLDQLFGNRLFHFILRPCLALDFIEHFNFRAKLRSLSKDEIASEIIKLLRLVGLTNFSRLNVLIGPFNDKNLSFGIEFMCSALNDQLIQGLLRDRGILIPENFQTNYGTSHNNKISYKSFKPTLEINRSLIAYLEKKTQFVNDRKKVKDIIGQSVAKKINTIIIGRRILTRGHVPLNDSSFIQSYDFKNDQDLKLLQEVLKKLLLSLKQTNSEALIVVENFPNKISYLISRDEGLKKLFHGRNIALACIEPDSKDIYFFEGNQFVQKSLKQIY
jgi:hypothetical protein